MVKSLYPGGQTEYMVDSEGNTEAYFRSVSSDDLAKVTGLRARFDRPLEVYLKNRYRNFPKVCLLVLITPFYPEIFLSKRPGISSG